MLKREIMMNKNALKKRKGGFSLVECVVALLLFSIVIGAVLTAFTSSHKQIDTQTDQYKIDLMSSNILAAYEGSNNADSFKSLMNALNIDTLSTVAFSHELEFAGEDDGKGEGVYSFDPKNVPIDPVAFDKIRIIDKTATIYRTDDDTDDDTDEALISFDGYEGNKLPNVEGINWDSLYTGKETIHYTKMSVSGKADIYFPAYDLSDSAYTYTVTLNPDGNGGKTNFRIQSNDKSADPKEIKERDACEFELYLLKNGWYLECKYRQQLYTDVNATTSHRTRINYDYFYFLVMDGNNSFIDEEGKLKYAPVKDKNGNCLFYRLIVPIDGPTSSCGYDGLYQYINSDDSKTYLNFDNIKACTEDESIIKHKVTEKECDLNQLKSVDVTYDVVDAAYGRIEQAYAPENAAYNEIDFDNHFLTKEDGSYFTGRWYYFPWLVANTVSVKTEKDKTVYKQITEGVPSIRESKVSEYVPLSDHGKNEYEYTPKDGVKSNIFYAYTKDGEMLLFNSEDTLVFKHENGIDAPLKDLQDNLGYGINGERNTQAPYNGINYDKWYKFGSVPDWQVRKVRFEDNPNGVSKIVFLGGNAGAVNETDFITYTYSKENYANFTADRQSILDFGGSLKNNRPTADGFELVLENDEYETTVFTAHTSSFSIAAADRSDYSTSNTSCTYNVISGGSEKADIEAITYYCTYSTGKTTLIVEATYSNYLKEFKDKDGKTQNIAPKIAIWIMPDDVAENLIDQGLPNVVYDEYKEYLQYEYRKG